MRTYLASAGLVPAQRAALLAKAERMNFELNSPHHSLMRQIDARRKAL